MVKTSSSLSKWLELNSQNTSCAFQTGDMLVIFVPHWNSEAGNKLQRDGSVAVYY